ncbi:major facilitator superfamily domain-containing protein [Stachybotrys elegans]|uniref:Major facilitator superfamily domain-containing protein n=1 Tax=Stachybotrys elegans TaxID=80388 RepID=A0A8K0SWR2_9HYPO|nr:major facilitator superfamily domain-containing protein [Stachybotrys elegans]
MTAEAKGPLPPPSTAQASILQTDPSDPITVVEDHVAVPEAAQQEDVAYTIYKPWQKRLIVAGTAVCCFYNPLSAQMYMPALNQLAEDFDVTPAQINLTVTTYLIFQGLTPLLVSGFSDALGRRPGYVAGFVVFLSANISLALAHEYTQMLIVRCLQSAGSSIIMVLCQAAVADIVTPAERGQYVSITAIPIILGPSLGPVIGGALTQYLGWRSIFWFLTIGSTINFILLLCLLPETCRNVVGDGSIRPPVIYRTLLQTITYSRKSSESESPPNLDSLGTSATSPRAPPAEKLPISKFVARTLLSSALLFTNPELVLLLCCGGIVFSGVYAIGTAAPNLFATLYQFNDLEVGLVYLPMAAGSILAVLVVGPTMNWNYRRHAKKLGLSVERNRTTDLSHFPIEKARLQIGLPLLLLGVAVMCCWGWIMANQADIEEVCALVFVTGICLAGVNNTIQALIIDIYPEKPGAVLAAYNLTKCMFGAVASAVIDPMIRAMGLGPAFTLLGALCLGFAPIIVIIMWKGIAWRNCRN